MAARKKKSDYTSFSKKPLYNLGASFGRSSASRLVQSSAFIDSEETITNSSWSTESQSKIKKVISEMSRVIKEFSDDGWDGSDAIGIKAESADLAVRFLQSLPNTVQVPEIIPEATGKIGIQWESMSSSLIITCGLNNKVTFGYYNSFGDEFFGTLQFIDELPIRLREFVNEFYG